MPTEPVALPDSSNAEQIAIWNDVLVAKFTRFRGVMVAGSAAHSDIAFRRHPVLPRELVLDVGCGFGETSIQLGRVVGPQGVVLGVDVCEPFLTVARQDARAAGLDQVTFRRADAQVEAFEPVFDVCFSRFGSMFFQDPIVALGNLRGAVRAGGRLLLVVWRRVEENEWAVLPLRIVLEHLPRPKKVAPRIPTWAGPGPFAFGKPEVMRGILQGSGWTNGQIEQIDTRMTVGQTIDEAVAFQLSVGPAGEVLREAGEAGVVKRPAIERDLAKALESHATPRGVLLGASSWCVTARR